MLRNKGARRLLAAFLVVLGGVLIFLAPETPENWIGLLLMAAGVGIEVAGIALERRT